MLEEKRLIKNSLIIAVGGLSSKVMAFLMLPLYTKYLSTSEYGSYDYIVSLATILLPIVTMLMQESMFRFLIDAKGKDDKKKIISHTFFLIILSLSVASVVMVAIFLLTKNNIFIFALMYLVALILGACTSALLRGEGKMIQYAVFNFSLTTSTMILNIIFIVVMKLGIVGLFSSYVIAHSFCSLIILFRIKIWRLISFKNISSVRIKEMLKYSVPLIPNSISWTIINFSDRFIVYNVFGPSANGIYAISNKFPSLIDTIYGFFYTAWKESASRVLHSKNQSEINGFYNLLYSNLKRIMLCISLFVIAAMPMLFRIFIHNNYSGAYNYVFILVFGVYFSNISGFYGGIFSAYKKTKIMGTTTIMAALLNIIINIALIWRIGLYAAAFSTLFANLIACGYRRIRLRELIEFKEDNRFIFVGTIVSVVVVFVYFKNSLLSSFLNICFVMIFSYIMNRQMIMAVMNKAKLIINDKLKK